MNSSCAHMVLLSGDQTAPNLLAARYYSPEQVFILHTDYWKSKRMAERLALRLSAMSPALREVAAFDPEDVAQTTAQILKEFPDTVVNVTGGTKPMSIGALQAAFLHGAGVIYVRSQGGKTVLDEYTFSADGRPKVERSFSIMDTISLEDYLVSYFGQAYQVTGCGGRKGSLGRAFEEAIEQALQPPMVDEVYMGWKHESGAVDVDAVIRCNNQVGIMEIKTGSKARTSEGIKQLAVAGGQRFFGTYTRRFLVVNQSWQRLVNLRALAEALDITVIEMPAYQEPRPLNENEVRMLKEAVYRDLSAPARYAQWHIILQAVHARCKDIRYFLSVLDERRFHEQMAGDWQAADKMIDIINASIGATRDDLLEDLAAWEPPPQARNIAEIVQAAIQWIDNGRHCDDWGGKKACWVVTNALRRQLEKMETG